jgi:hypothetical protein
MVELYFIVRHTPWWAVPLIIMGGEFAYFFWLKKKRKTAYGFVMMALIGFLSISFYMWAGGPNKAVKILKKMHRDYQ